MNKITCICLGVKDMERSIKFYRDGLGYKTDCRENSPSVCFFDTPGTKFELFPLEQLEKDIDENNPPKGNGFSGITLAYNVEHRRCRDCNCISKKSRWKNCKRATGSFLGWISRIFFGFRWILLGSFMGTEFSI